MLIKKQTIIVVICWGSKKGERELCQGENNYWILNGKENQLVLMEKCINHIKIRLSILAICRLSGFGIHGII